ncbi:hypothetical protein E2320_009515, partial [Naja naja]
ICYENPGMFTSAQLTQIKQINLARIICDNSDHIQHLQRDIFRWPPTLKAWWTAVKFLRWICTSGKTAAKVKKFQQDCNTRGQLRALSQQFRSKGSSNFSYPEENPSKAILGQPRERVASDTEQIPERKQLWILWHVSGFLCLLPITCFREICPSQDGKAEMKVVHTWGIFTEPGREDKRGVAVDDWLQHELLLLKGKDRFWSTFLTKSLKLDDKATLERVASDTEQIPERKQLWILWHVSGFLCLLPITCFREICPSQDGKAEMKVVHTWVYLQSQEEKIKG